MAKNKIILSFIFGFTIWSNSFSQGDLRYNIRKTYYSQIGIRELTGNNDGEVEKYLKAVGLPKGNPYCAAFLEWVLEQNRIYGAKSGYSPLWFPANKITTNPKHGDVFGIYFASKKRIAHVGFVDSIAGDWVITVEANTNDALSRDGDGVYKKRRLKKQIYKFANWIADQKSPVIVPKPVEKPSVPIASTLPKEFRICFIGEFAIPIIYKDPQLR